MHKIIIAALIAAGLAMATAAPAAAQGCGPSNPNCIVPTAPPGTNNSQAASTAFVGAAIAELAPVVGPVSSTVGNLAIWNNATGSLLADGGPSQVVPNIRPTNETSYTVLSTDSYVVNRNVAVPTNWSLGPGIGNRLAGLTLRNDSAWYPVIVALTGGATVNDNFTTLVLDPLQSSTLVWDGTQYRGGMSSAGRNSTLGNIVNMVGYGAAIGPLTATLSGTVTVGNVVGFDYTFDPGSGPVTFSPRHTMVGGDTLLTAWQDIQNQFCASTAVKAWIGVQIFNFGCVPVFTLTSPVVGWDQFYPNVTSTLTAVSGSTGIVTIGGQGNLNLDGGSSLVGGMSPLVYGRQPLVGDAIFQIYVLGDGTSSLAPVRQITPSYGLMSWNITNPTPGSLKANLLIQTDTNEILGSLGVGAKPQFLFHEVGATGISTNAVFDSFAASTFLITRRADGTAASPATIAGPEQINSIIGEGYNGSSYAGAAAITMRATQAFSGTQNAANIGFFITANGTTANVEAMRLEQSGVLILDGLSGTIPSTAPVPITGVELQVIGPAATATGAEVTSFGAGSFFYGRSIGGTPASPTALTNNSVIAGFDARGYNGAATIETAALSFTASQAWSAGATGSRGSMFTSANGTSVLVERERWDQDGSILVPATVTGGGQGAGTINATGLYQAGVQVATSTRNINTTSPLTGGGNLTADRTIACATCATTTSGGALSATSPIAISAGGVISITSPVPIANGGTNDTGSAWTSYTPTISSLAGTITTASAVGRFKTLGKTVWVQIAATITTNGTGATAVTATLPVNSSGLANYALAGYNATTAKLLAGLATTGAATRINIFQYDGTYPAASGDTLVITGTYESP